MFKLKMDFYHFMDKVSVLNYIWWLFVVNLLFWMTSLPCLFILVFFNLNLVTMGLLFLFSLLIGPSLGSVIYSLLKLQEGDERLVKNYVYYYKHGFWKLVRYSLPYVLLLGVVAFNLLFTNELNQLKFLKLGNMLIACLLITHFINFILVTVKHETSFKQTMKLCFYLMMVKSVRYNGNFIILLSTVVLFSYVPVYLLLYGVSVFCLLIIKNFQTINLKRKV